MTLDSTWLGIGFAGQAMFSGRFLVQWLASERSGRSVVPKMFWTLSILGSLFLLSYAIHLRDPVFIIGQSAGFLIYGRNLRLLARERSPRAASG
jgi:lipid-A-disaccharide synthase-like uncharacterized protein